MLILEIIKMNKTHLKVNGADYRDSGQTEYEYEHQAACGYVRKSVSRNEDSVDCRHCLNSIHMISYHAINKTGTDSQGCY